MRKVLPSGEKEKRLSRKVADTLSGCVITLTVLILLLVTGLTVPHNNESVKTSGFAIYKGEPKERAAALMFNVYEGAENVMKILSILRNYSAKATFFIGGVWAEKNARTLLEITLEGHELGSHGYLHKDHAKLSVEQNKEEITKSNRIIKNVTGRSVRLFAPPSGSFGENTEIACRALGQKMILWTKDTIDWRDNDVALLVKRATENIASGDLILMHPKDQTVLALPKIIEAYQKEGYALLPVGEIVK